MSHSHNHHDGCCDHHENHKLEVFKLNIEQNEKSKKQEEIEKNDLKDATIKLITQNSMRIEKEIKNAELQYQIESNKIENFEYKKDKEGHPTNGDEFKQIWDKRNDIMDQLKDLREAKNLCDKSLEELKQPSEQKTLFDL